VIEAKGKIEGKMLYRLILSMKHQCLYDEALKEIKELIPLSSIDEKEQKLISKLENDIKKLIKKFKNQEKKMFKGALG
jgi:uncharacterized membrane protein